MLPVLTCLADGAEHVVGQLTEDVADAVGLTAEERREFLPSGKQAIYRNRVAWAETYLAKAGVVEPTRRGHLRITERGRELLATKPTRVDNQVLARYPEFESWRRKSTSKSTGTQRSVLEDQPNDVLETPEETLGTAYRRIRQDLADTILDQVKASSPAFFERLVVDLLVQMGYGGSVEDAGRAVGQSGDEGIDGVIKEDRLGLDTIYLQAKRWEGTVGRPEIQKFAGALQGQRARKGVFMTTSSFSKEAREFASRIDTTMVLVDGEQLAELMVDHGVGVSTAAVYEVKRIDTDYFEEG